MTIKVLQLICPSGYYGAERWVNALLSVQPSSDVEQHLAITDEPGACDDVLLRSGLPTARQHRIPMASKFDLRVVKRLVDLIRQQGIHIIHTHGYKSDILGVLAAKWAGIASVCTPHGFENSTDKRLRAYIWLGGKAFHGFDWVCPLSPDIQKTVLEQYRVNPKRVRLITNGVDLAEVEAALAEAQPETTDEFRIGYIGQLISRKNLTATLQAFAALLASQPHCRLVLIGDGDERALLQQLAQQLAIADKVDFMGFRDDRLALLPTFDCFVLTSSLEGIPRCLMEAMAAKVCVTAFNIPGVDRLIEHNNTGLLADYGDTEALTALWQRLIDNPEQKQQLAEAGCAHVYQNFSAQAMELAYSQLYHELIAAKAGRSAQSA
ncbi:glycosyltransferase [Alkalimonas amylolytica]|uniref:Glycosyltransferase involved in cell wall bisynthesis n=1 Tax=Alkalimonas amylolytica TaxID=152573 RepID=A0A1H4CBP9_ALKAM|nr:glycosyltransferase [Alkalimonas amylolytica]SEA57778.1 Glycosyltransferase involved in cell wall bisynthesis [Alkalimonas amylolytica]